MTILIGIILWIAVLNLTFKKNPISKKDDEYVDIKNKNFNIIEDFNSTDELDDYIADVEKIYKYQKQEIHKLRIQINRLLRKD